MFATITIVRAGRDLEVEVRGRYQRTVRGSRDRYGLPLEPDEPAGMELLETGGLDLTGAEEEEAIEALLEAKKAQFDPPEAGW